METEESNDIKYLSPEDIFNLFCDAEDFPEILRFFKDLRRSLQITSGEGLRFYQKLKSCLRSWKCQALWDLLDARANQIVYNQGQLCENVRVFVIGAGPIGLRTAIECALLGCQVVLIDKRTTFSRHNVLHLWSFLLNDFRTLGAKKFYGKFGAGAIDHVSIRVLQAILLKTTLLVGVQVFSGITFQELVEPSSVQEGWRAKCSPENHPINKWKFNVIIGADGKKNVLPGFQQIEMRGKVAIGITCNFINYNTIEEAKVQEISGIAYQFKPAFFDSLDAKQGVRLENIVYYKDATHYFVMTAVKSSLLQRGVLKEDLSDPARLLDRSNVNQDELVSYTCDAVNFATDYQLPKLDLLTLDNGSPDIALFDFTSIKKASNACRILERKEQRLLMALVGDSLIEPFWPTGSGCGRGVLSALDTAWMIRQYAKGYPPLYVIRDRENIFKLLSGTSNDNLQKNVNAYTIDPKTRYSNVSSKKMMTVAQLKGYYDTDDPQNADYSIAVPEEQPIFDIGIRFSVNKTKIGRRKSAGRRKSSHGKNRRKSSQTDNKQKKSDGLDEENDTKGIPSKRSKSSTVHSGSISSGLQSISESDVECYSGSLSSTTYSRQNSQTMQSLCESTESGLHPRRVRNASQCDLDDVFLASSSDHEETGGKRKPATIGRPTKTQKWFKRTISSHKSEQQDSEKKRTAARKSIGQAKKYKLRRLSREHGNLHSSKAAENTAATASLQRLGSGRVKELGQVLTSEFGQDQTNYKFKEPLSNKSSTGSSKSGALHVKNGDRIPVTKSCKELIAAAEARDKWKKESAKERLPSEQRNAPRALKRKADEINHVNKRKSINREIGSIVGDIMNVSKTDIVCESISSEKVFEIAVCRAAGLLLAVPLLLNCELTSASSRTANKKGKEETENTKATLTTTSKESKSESEQFQRTGSVQKKREEYLAMIARRESEKKSYFEFKKKKTDNQETDGNAIETESLMSTSSRASLEQSDFVPKDVIDAETCLVNDSEEKKKISIGGSEKKVPLKCKDSLETALKQLKEESPRSLERTIKILIAIHKKIQESPDDSTYYRVYVLEGVFQQFVWNVLSARLFMEILGWSRCGSFLLLSRSVVVNEAVTKLENCLRSIQNSESTNRQRSLNNNGKQYDNPGPKQMRKFSNITAAAPTKSIDDIVDDLEETNIDIEEDNPTDKPNERINAIEDDYVVLGCDEVDAKMNRLSNSGALSSQKTNGANEQSSSVSQMNQNDKNKESISTVVNLTGETMRTLDKASENSSENQSQSKYPPYLEKQASIDEALEERLVSLANSRNLSGELSDEITVHEKKKTRAKFPLSLRFSKNKKKQNQSLSSPTSPSNDSFSPAEGNTRSGTDETSVKPENTNIKSKLRSRLSKGLGQRPKQEKGTVNSSQSLPQPHVTEETQKKKKKRILRIVKKRKKEQISSSLSSSWANLSDDELKKNSAVGTSVSSETGHEIAIGHSNGGKLPSGGIPKDDVPNDSLEIDSGLCSTDDHDSVISPRENVASENTGAKVKVKKKKFKLLRVKKKESQRDSGILSDVTSTESSGKEKYPAEDNVSVLDKSKTSLSNASKRETETRKNSSKDTSPKKIGKLRKISTSPVEI